MATKIICDRCESEIDMEKSNEYHKLYFMFGRDDDVEEYDLCGECFTSVKRSLFNNFLEYKQIQR